ncbi:MAG: aminotransferase class IV [Candidatus Omnitrophota bacterium]
MKRVRPGNKGLFETMRSFGGRVFALDEHLDRLIRSCPVVGMKAPLKKALEKAVKDVIKKDGLKDAYVRLNVFKQPKGSGIFVFTKKLSLPGIDKYRRGFSLALYKSDALGLPPYHKVKSLNHSFYTGLTCWARERGFDEALFLNARMYLVEGSRTNVFLIKAGCVVTPAVWCGCLPGVTRKVVIGLFKKLKIRIKEARIPVQELFCQDEIFVTNSLIGVMPATRINKKPVGNGRPGNLTQRVMAAYEKEIENECFLR